MRTALPLLAASLLAAPLTGCMHRVALADPAGLTQAEPPPPGMVDLNIVSGDYRTWDVYLGDEPVCATPCLRRVGVDQGITVMSREREGLIIPNLGVDAMAARRAVLMLEGTSYGEKVNGIVFTTLGGMGTVVGIALTAIGCSNTEERPGTCNAGLITGGISLPLTGVAIWMIIDSLPKARVLPVFQTKASNGQPGMSVAVGPNGVYGRF